MYLFDCLFVFLCVCLLACLFACFRVGSLACYACLLARMINCSFVCVCSLVCFCVRLSVLVCSFACVSFRSSFVCAVARLFPRSLACLLA